MTCDHHVTIPLIHTWSVEVVICLGRRGDNTSMVTLVLCWLLPSRHHTKLYMNGRTITVTEDSLWVILMVEDYQCEAATWMIIIILILYVKSAVFKALLYGFVVIYFIKLTAGNEQLLLIPSSRHK